MVKPYAIIECSDETARKVKQIKRKNIEEFVANKLHEMYPDKFPAWLNCFGERNIFWHNNIIEDYEDAYGRLLEDRMQMIIEYYIDDAYIYDAKWRFEEELESLPKFVI
ncbi:MAG: hypothetical protein RXO36_03690 [Candidatus Nanopusillus acidilobi]